MKPFVYLAGPMDNCTEEEAYGWRQQASLYLKNLECLDPTRRGLHVLEMNQIVELDKQDIDRAQTLLVNCWRPQMVGTHFEMMYAWDRKKYIVVVAPDINKLSPWILYHSHAAFTSLEEACNFISKT